MSFTNTGHSECIDFQRSRNARPTSEQRRRIMGYDKSRSINGVKYDINVRRSYSSASIFFQEKDDENSKLKSQLRDVKDKLVEMETKLTDTTVKLEEKDKIINDLQVMLIQRKSN